MKAGDNFRENIFIFTRNKIKPSAPLNAGVNIFLSSRKI